MYYKYSVFFISHLKIDLCGPFFAGADPNCKDFDCRTPLHSAIVKGSRSYDCVRLLLDGGADVNHKDRYTT
jgi:ankyrin repeat protein